MDFGFSEDQELSRATARKFLDAACPTTLVRELCASATAHSTALWERMVELGWLGILVPADLGGLGGSFLDVAVVLEEMGRVVLPGPYFATVLLGGSAIAAGGSPAQQRAFLPRLARGELRTTLAVAEADGRDDAGSIATQARRDGTGWLLTGAKLFVLDAHVADELVVAARTAPDTTGEDGISLFVVPAAAPGVGITQLKSVDTTRRVTRVTLDGVRVEGDRLLGAPGAGWPVVRRTLDRAIVGLVIEMVGTAQRALDMAVAYAKERIQFGKPIGGFQAIKHKCVDMMVEVENARSLAYYAAWTVDETRAESRQAVPMAKAYASDMCKNVCSQAIQVHGGIGFTWEHDIHLFYRRALASEAAFGASPVHREIVARAMAF